MSPFDAHGSLENSKRINSPRDVCLNLLAGFLFVFLLHSLLISSGCGTQSAPRQVIFILLDAARADRFSCYGYELTTPHMDALAGRGMLFKNHFTQETATRSSLPTFFYSRYYTLPLFPVNPTLPLVEPDNLFRRLDNQCISLPKVLSNAGLKTTAISAHYWLRKGTQFEKEFDELHNLVSDLEPGCAYPSAEKVIDYTISWIDENQDKDYFLYIHLMDTHFPHLLGEDALKFLGASPAPVDRFDQNGRPKYTDRHLTEAERVYLDALYDGSLHYTDRHLGRLVQKLESMRRLDETMIIITSDHGEHLVEQPGRFSHGGPWYEAVGKIPLIISYPQKLDAGLIEAFTGNVDIYPTLLHILDCPLPAGKLLDGRNLLSTTAAAGIHGQYAFMKRGIRGERYKLLSDRMDRFLLNDEPVNSNKPAGLLYDLHSDPGEIHDLWTEKPDIVEELLSVFRTRMKSPYQRFINAVSHEQPRSIFVISTRDFQPNQRVIDTTSYLPDRPDRFITDEKYKGQWVASRHSAFYWLLACEGAKPMLIRFPIPNGEYHVSASLTGRFSLAVREGEAPLEFKDPPVVPGRNLEWEEVSLGRLIIKENMFQALMVPLSGTDCFLIKHFVFRPVGVPERDNALDENLLEQLRALGYAK